MWKQHWETRLIVIFVIFTLIISTILPIGSPKNANDGRINATSYENEIKTTPPGWTEDVRLSFSGTYPEKNLLNFSGWPTITSWENYVHAVWTQYSINATTHFTVNGEIYYRRSTTYGQTWDSAIRLTYNPFVDYNLNQTPNPWYGSNVYPRIAVNDSNVHIVFERIMFPVPAREEILYINSTDYGQTWNQEQMLTANDTYCSDLPDIAVNGSNVHVGWTDQRNSPPSELYYRNSTTDGKHWNDEQRLTIYSEGPVGAGTVRIAVNNSNIHILFNKYWISPEPTYMNSTDGGITWSPPQLLTENDGIVTYVGGIAVNNSNIHITYRDNIDGSQEIYYLNSTNGGTTWNPAKRISDLPDRSEQPEIAVDGDNIHVVWIDNRDHYGFENAFEIYYANSTDGGISWGSNIRLTTALNLSVQPDIDANNGYVHVVWMDNRTMDYFNHHEIYYKRSPDFPQDPEYNVSLSEGWNLISLPLEQSNESIDQVLSSIDGKWDCIQAYDAINDIWLSNVTSRPDGLNDLKTLNDKVGFWINITEPGGTILTVNGYDPPSTLIPLYTGWNLIGYPTLNNTTTVANALFGTTADAVEVFDPTEPYHIREVGPTYVMKPGEGYWIHVVVDSVWAVNW